MRRDTVYSLVGVGVGFGLLLGMVYALDKSQQAAAAKAASGNAGATQPRDPWAALKTQVNLLQQFGNSFKQLAASALPSGQRIVADVDYLVHVATFQIMGKPPPAGSANITAYSQGLPQLNADVATISSWDVPTAQSAAAILGQANAVLATAVATLPPPSPQPQGNA